VACAELAPARMAAEAANAVRVRRIFCNMVRSPLGEAGTKGCGRAFD
jgi:hypothetical protein